MPPLSRSISTVNKTIVQQAGTFLKYTLKIPGGTETEKAKNMVFQPPLLGLPLCMSFFWADPMQLFEAETSTIVFLAQVDALFDLSLTDMAADTDCLIKSLVEPLYPNLGITCVAWWNMWNRFLASLPRKSKRISLQ